MNNKDQETQYELPLYGKRDVVIVKGKDATLWDEQGKAYIDCVGGQGVANIGHANEHVAAAISAQAQILITCPELFYNDKRAALLKKLVEISPAFLTKAFFCNSGAESIEAALKFARFTTGKTDFICAMRAYHGRTMGALSATFNPKYKQDFMPLVNGFSFVPFNNTEALAEAITDKTAGVILELIQGEGGINVAEQAYIDAVQALCKEKGVLLIIDEVQTGFCRTGTMFACEQYGVEPDIMCLAKSLAGGVPMGAVLCSDKVKAPAGNHSTTFGGNPLSCAASLAAIGVMEKEGLAAQAAEKGRYIVEQLSLQELSKVREIRGKGLMIGIELKEKAKPYIEQLMDKGILVLASGPTVIRLLPPLVITQEQIDAVVAALREMLA